MGESEGFGMALQAPDKLYTFDEFWAFIHQPENEHLTFELHEGELVTVPPSRKLNSTLGGLFITFLNLFVLPRKLGVVVGADAGFRINAGSYVQADAAFVAGVTPADLPFDEVYFEQAPDIAVEIVSPREDVISKARLYLQAGTRLVWAVFVPQRIVTVLRLNERGRVVGEDFGVDDTLDGGDVLPGFTLALRDIFGA